LVVSDGRRDHARCREKETKVEELEESREVDAPIETCWNVLTDPALGAHWLAFADEVQAEGEPGIGQKLIARGSLLGAPINATSEVDKFEAPRVFGWSGAKPFRTDFRFELTEVDASTTRIDSTVALDPGKYFPVGKRMAMRAVKGQVRKSADALASLIEEQADS
jgi:carbon monoxide dehydrogenase subunit G